MRNLYMSKANRDAAFKLAGGTKAGYHKRSIRNQNLHPQYVTDYPEKLSATDCGFGNTLYQTSFGVLYSFVKVMG